jgi:hypothetical protein
MVVFVRGLAMRSSGGGSLSRWDTRRKLYRDITGKVRAFPAARPGYIPD